MQVQWGEQAGAKLLVYTMSNSAQLQASVGAPNSRSWLARACTLTLMGCLVQAVFIKCQDEEYTCQWKQRKQKHMITTEAHGRRGEECERSHIWSKNCTNPGIDSLHTFTTSSLRLAVRWLALSLSGPFSPTVWQIQAWNELLRQGRPANKI